MPIYAGHFLDVLFEAVSWPDGLSALQVNRFPVVTIAETGETIPTTNPDQLVLAATLPGRRRVSAHLEGGKRNGSAFERRPIGPTACGIDRRLMRCLACDYEHRTGAPQMRRPTYCE